MNRWRFETLDGSESYTFGFNPNAAGNPWSSRSVDWQFDRRGGYTGVRSGREPVEWTFGGVVKTHEQYQAFIDWLSKDTKIRLVTDLGETHIIRLLSFAPKQAAPSSNLDKYAYEIRALLYDEVDLTTGSPLFNPTNYRLQVSGEMTGSRVMTELLLQPAPAFIFWYVGVTWSLLGVEQPERWRVNGQIYAGSERYARVELRSLRFKGQRRSGDRLVITLEALSKYGAAEAARITHVTGSGPAATSLPEDNRVQDGAYNRL